MNSNPAINRDRLKFKCREVCRRYGQGPKHARSSNENWAN